MDDGSGYEAGSEGSRMDDVSGNEARSSEASRTDDVSGNEARSEASPMDDESGYEAGSEDPPTSSSGSETSLAAVKAKPIKKKKKKEPCEPCEPCEVCGSATNGHLMMTCIACRDTREHIYCARVKLQRVPPMWLCEECRGPPSIPGQSAPYFQVLEVPGLRDFLRETRKKSTPESSHPVTPCPPELKQPQGMDISTDSKSEESKPED